MMQRFSVRAFWLTALLLAMLQPFRPAPIRAQAQGQTFEGTLSIRWGDPRFPGTAGAVRYILTTPDGTYVPMDVTQDANEVLRFNGHRVIVTGQAVSRPAAAGAAGSQAIVATSIVDDPRLPPQAAFSAAGSPEAVVSGTKKVLFLLLKYAGDTQTPHAASFFLDMTNPDPSINAQIPTTINSFFKKVSNNTFSWVGDVGGAGGLGAPAGYLVLPQPKSYYANCGFSSSCFDFARFDTDAVAVAKANGINFLPYDNVNFVINNDLDCCAWGGGVIIDGKSFGATWEPPWGQITSTYGHEMGHSLGLPHSGWTYASYDSPWDTMSDIRVESGSVLCGSYSSANSGGAASNLFCDTPGDGYIAGHRDFLGWIPPANQVSVSAGSNASVALEGNAIALSTGVKLIKICLPGVPCTGTAASTRYFTVEGRVKGGGATTRFDNAIPNEGVIIHDFWFGRPKISGGCYFNNQSGWALPIDATPGDFSTSTCSGQGLSNAQFAVGQSYTNSTYGFKVTVNSRVGNTFNVTVQSLGTQITIDAPAAGSSVTAPFNVQGWAVNPAAASGSGVASVHLYLGPTGSAQSFLGVATYGTSRPDVGAIFGSQFNNSGFTFNGGAGLAAGSYTLTAYAQNAMTGTFDVNRSVTFNVSVPTTMPFIDLDTPREGYVTTSAFEVGGWALDYGSPTGTGVDAVVFYVFPNDGASPGVYIGQGSYGLSRPDVGAIFGSRFNTSGFHYTISGLGPGAFMLGVYARSTLTGTYSVVKTIHFTVNATALMALNPPVAEAVITSNIFNVDGWSIDRAIESTALAGSGVDSLHVYAYPNPGSGAPPVFLGVASVGLSRPDVAALYGSRYGTSGYHLGVDRSALGLAPGPYNIVAHSHSTVTGTFNNAAIVRVTLQ
jgi:hypothetical protein